MQQLQAALTRIVVKNIQSFETDYLGCACLVPQKLRQIDAAYASQVVFRGRIQKTNKLRSI